MVHKTTDLHKTNLAAFGLYVLQHKPTREQAAKEFGVSVRTLDGWLRELRAGGVKILTVGRDKDFHYEFRDQQGA